MLGLVSMARDQKFWQVQFSWGNLNISVLCWYLGFWQDMSKCI